jgi:hypothetical protein
MERRRLFLALALVGTVTASIWAAYLPEDSSTPPVSRAGREPVRLAHRDAATQLGTLQRSAGVPAAASGSLAIAPRLSPTQGSQDVFGGALWNPPPAAVSAPPPPQPPPMPFVYNGRMEIAGRESFLLLEGMRTHIVPVGGEASGFRLEGADASALSFLHLASGQRVALALKP